MIAAESGEEKALYGDEDEPDEDEEGREEVVASADLPTPGELKGE
jgi:hypothetical protein